MQGLWGRAQGLGMDLGLKAFTLRMSLLVLIIIPIQGRRFINQGPGLGCRVQSLGLAHDNLIAWDRPPTHNDCGLGWVLPPLTNSWIITIIRIYIYSP